MILLATFCSSLLTPHGEFPLEARSRKILNFAGKSSLMHDSVLIPNSAFTHYNVRGATEQTASSLVENPRAGYQANAGKDHNQNIPAKPFTLPIRSMTSFLPVL